MAYKLGRNYILTVNYGTSPEVNLSITIQPPFSIEFDVLRNDYACSNASKVKIYNLSADTRGKLRKDVNDAGNIKSISLKIGYGNILSQVLTANVSQAWSYRQGVDFITEIDSYDAGGAFTQATFNGQFPAGTPQSSVIKALAESLIPYGLSVGAIGDFTGNTGRGNSYSGSTTDLLTQLTNGGFFVDNGKIYCLQQNEAVGGSIFQIDSSSGLLNTPMRENTIIDFDMLLEPRLFINQLINLTSSTDPTFNGTYKVVAIHHKGMISNAVAGEATTSVRAEAGKFAGVSP